MINSTQLINDLVAIPAPTGEEAVIAAFDDWLRTL